VLKSSDKHPKSLIYATASAITSIRKTSNSAHSTSPTSRRRYRLGTLQTPHLHDPECHAHHPKTSLDRSTLAVQASSRKQRSSTKSMTEFAYPSSWKSPGLHLLCSLPKKEDLTGHRSWKTMYVYFRSTDSYTHRHRSKEAIPSSNDQHTTKLLLKAFRGVTYGSSGRLPPPHHHLT
jgi:hypothetical protein